MRLLLAICAVASLASVPGDGDARRIPLDKTAKAYIFPKAMGDDVRICMEVGPEHLVCVTAKHLRERFDQSTVRR